MDLASIVIVLSTKPGSVLLLPGLRVKAIDDVLNLLVIKGDTFCRRLVYAPQTKDRAYRRPKARIVQGNPTSRSIEVSASCKSVTLSLVAAVIVKPVANRGRTKTW